MQEIFISVLNLIFTSARNFAPKFTREKNSVGVGAGGGGNVIASRVAWVAILFPAAKRGLYMEFIVVEI